MYLCLSKFDFYIDFGREFVSVDCLTFFGVEKNNKVSDSMAEKMVHGFLQGFSGQFKATFCCCVG